MTVRLPSFSKMNLPQLRELARHPGLVLASGSPRRRKILEEIGIDFEVVVPQIDEEDDGNGRPEELAVKLADRKVLSVDHDERRFYLGCDTIVVYDRKVLMKPRDEDDALRILTILSGRTHSVFTGLALYDSRSRQGLTGVEESRVKFNPWPEAKLREYIATGEPLDKAGAYGIQGMGRFLVDTVEGNIDNVIGLPLSTLEYLASQCRGRYA